MKTIKIYYIDNEYINYLRKFDTKVPYNKSATRPYIGIVYTFEGKNYFAPLSSPKPKHIKISDKAIDVYKINKGKWGIVNINNMLPAPLEYLKEVLPLVKDRQYKTLLENQITYINDHKKELLNKVRVFQTQYRKGHLPANVKDRCCDFSLLEIKCKEYIEKTIEHDIDIKI